jgi:hypothetical protein
MDPQKHAARTLSSIGPVGIAATLALWTVAFPGTASAQSGYAYRITDPLVGSSLDSINTAFWEPWSAPGATGAPTVSSEGFTLSGQLNYLGLLGAAGGPIAKWLLVGDFRISILLAQGSSATRRNHATVYEVVDCATLGKTVAGVWGGAGAQVGNAPGDHYAMPAGGAAYYLFAKKGATLTIYQGNATGVSEADTAVLAVTLPNPDAPYIFYLGVGSPNDNTMTARDLVVETQGLASCPAGTAIPETWKAPGACTCTCQGVTQPGHGYKVTDPLVGSSLGDINTAFWEPWSAPTATGAPAISSAGFTLSGQLNYLGLMGAAGGPLAKWLLGGDFRISILLAQGSSTTRRNHATVYEVVDCATLGKTVAGVWGGAGALVGNAPGDHYAMPAGGAAYYLFAKQGAGLTIYQGDASGVSEASTPVLAVTLPNPDAAYIFYLGVGSPNDNTMTARDFVLETQSLASCPAGVTPAQWCDCGCTGGAGGSTGVDGGATGGVGGSTGVDGGSTSGDDKGGGGGCNLSDARGPGSGILLGLLFALALVHRRARHRTSR